MSLIDHVSFRTLLIVALVLGLTPYVPVPHVIEKLRMLSQGTLTRPIDIADLIMHGTPWLLLAWKVARTSK